MPLRRRRPLRSVFFISFDNRLVCLCEPPLRFNGRDQDGGGEAISPNDVGEIASGGGYYSVQVG